MLGISSNTLCLNWFNYALKFSMIQLRSIRSSPLICEFAVHLAKTRIASFAFPSMLELD